MAKKKDKEPVEEVSVEEPVEEVSVEEPVEEVVEEIKVEETPVEKPVEAPVSVPEYKKCNRCKTEMVEESKDGFEVLLKCPKCGARKSKC